MAIVTISEATPAVVTWPAHGFIADQAVWFATQTIQAPFGALPAPILPGILCYVLQTGLDTDVFEIALTPGGAAINTTDAGLGAITGTATVSALNTFCPPIDPSSGTKTKPELKLKEAAFGDGYTQTTRDGLNHIRKVVTLHWELLIESQADAIEAFCENQGGDTPFYYALRGDSSRKWTCKDWDRDRGNPNKISMTLRQDFSLLV